MYTLLTPGTTCAPGNKAKQGLQEGDRVGLNLASARTGFARIGVKFMISDQAWGGIMDKAKKTILVVDDNEALVDALDLLLADDYEVLPATDAYQALEILHFKEPALIFLDMFMPGYNGLQLLREIRQMNLASRVVVITAAEAYLLGDEIQSLGVDGFLRKPFDVHDIQGFAAAA